MPGVDSRNVYALLGRCDSLDSISKLSETEIASLLENGAAAKLLYSGFHSRLLEEDPSAVEDSKQKSSKPSSYRVGLKNRGDQR